MGASYRGEAVPPRRPGGAAAYARRVNLSPGAASTVAVAAAVVASASFAAVGALLRLARVREHSAAWGDGQTRRRAGRPAGPAPRPPATVRSSGCASRVEAVGTTSPRACATSRSSATTPSATWVAGCPSPPPSSTTAGDGLVITSIHARGESRTYAKGIVGGGCEHHPDPRGAAGPRAPAPAPDPRVSRDHRAHASDPASCTRLRLLRPARARSPRWRCDAWAAGRGRRSTSRSRSVDAALDALRAGDVDAAMVPIENSVEGGVSATLDALASGRAAASSCGEVLVPITFVLAARPGMPLDRGPRRRHPPPRLGPGAGAGWARNLPDAAYVPTLSTAAARGRPRRAAPARRGIRRRRLRAGRRGATTASRCSPRTSATTPRAVTRFVLVARPGTLPEPTGADKTTRRALPARRPRRAACSSCSSSSRCAASTCRGSSRGRPATAMGDYCFSIDFEGHVARRAGRRGADGAAPGLRARCGSSAPTRGRTAARPRVGRDQRQAIDGRADCRRRPLTSAGWAAARRARPRASGSSGSAPRWHGPGTMDAAVEVTPPRGGMMRTGSASSWLRRWCHPLCCRGARRS